MFKPLRDDLADDWLDSPETLVKAALDDGESLVWVGGSASRIGFALKEWSNDFLGLVLFFFTLGWSIGVAYGGRNNWDRGQPVPPFAWHNVLIASANAAVMLPIGLAMLSTPFQAWCRAAGICYALTDRRAIDCRCDHRGCLILDQLLPRSLEDIERKLKPDGSGDLTFGIRPTLMRGLTRPFDFIHIANVLEVEALASKTLGPLVE
jgi:hypothetical protein